MFLLFCAESRWTGGGRGKVVGGGGVPVVMLDANVDQLESALGVVDRAGNVNTSDVRRKGERSKDWGVSPIQTARYYKRVFLFSF